MKLNTYLNFDGNCQEAFDFYKSVFGGEFIKGCAMKFKDLPDFQVKEEEKDRIMHISLQVGENILMGSDILPSIGHKLNLGTTNYVVISPETRKEADRIYKELSKDGEIEMELSEQFFGYFASFRDKFGILWMINVNE